ncbi:MAG: GNAT family N-acetyltransferase [Magnetococcales bacterium]|nr:GNAT family N-acetyltransferase [Magnetococcales bacterium]
MEYRFSSLPGRWVSPELIDEYAKFYSEHYGYWQSPAAPLKRIKLGSEHLKKWFTDERSQVAEARLQNELIGYAISIQAKTAKGKIISWVTQLVVHSDHRQKGVGKELLFSAWCFSDHFAWGLLSSNPYAVRALEKATRRRCDPARIHKNRKMLFNFGLQHVWYIKPDTCWTTGENASIIDTTFNVDHSRLPEMIEHVTSPEKPWLLGELPDGWEWAAFTFQDQPQFSLTQGEIEQMLQASDQTVKQAYSRMLLDHDHQWARHTAHEVQWIIDACQLEPGDTVLDVGCGRGRHSNGLGLRGYAVTGVDYLENFISSAKANKSPDSNVEFIVGDCRSLRLGRRYSAVICLYDVIGSYADEEDNRRILNTLAEHLREGGLALLSVMNFELTNALAKHHFSLADNPDELLNLKASDTMERTGDIFDPDYFMIDRDTHLCYRKEQFKEQNQLHKEYIVRDKRYTQAEIETLCAASGLQVVWSRFVRAGDWTTPLPNTSPKAKEILLLCRKAGASVPDEGNPTE